MTQRVVVVIDDLSQIGPVEEAIITLAAAGEQDFHVVSTDRGESLVSHESTPRRLRLLFLMARLADRLIPVTGEHASITDTAGLRGVISRLQPDRVYVADHCNPLQRLLRRDLCSRLRRLVDIDVLPLPIAA